MESPYVLAHLPSLDDSALWQASRATMPEGQQDEWRMLLDAQAENQIPPEEAERLQELIEVYGRLLVRQAHAWLLLARRGYRVPMQPPQAQFALPRPYIASALRAKVAEDARHLLHCTKC